MEKKHIVFMGTPPIAAKLLASLLERPDVIIDAVVTQPDRRTGRKQKLSPSPVKELALAHDLPVLQPEKIRQDFQELLTYTPDLIVTCAYGQIVPQEVLDLPKYEAVNLHGSLLPAYRGAAPIQRAVWNREPESGMSLMRMVKKMDAGPVLDMEKIALAADETTSTLFEKMGDAACVLLGRNLDTLVSGNADFKEQNEAEVSFAAMITREEEELDLSKTDAEIEAQIRALADEPGAYVIANGKKLKILKADYRAEKPEDLGLLRLEDRKHMSLSLHEGKLWLEKVQLQGKPVMDISAFVNGQGRSLDGTIVKGKGDAA